MGLVADIQRFSVHDGPGIRTTVFLKGCNLACAWCHNPETISGKPQFLLKPERCIGCGGCDEGCFSGARVLCGTQMSARDVLKEIVRDQPYYGDDGGVTVSGGEPAYQADFTRELLGLCREAGIHTIIESNMSYPIDIMRPLWSLCDMVLADIKLWDDARHKAWTGAGNERILSNITACAKDGVPIRIHTPVVAGINDCEDEIGSIAAFAAGLGTLESYELLPYHPLGLAKGALEGYVPQRFETPSKERMEALARHAAAFGIPVRVSGKAV